LPLKTNDVNKITELAWAASIHEVGVYLLTIVSIMKVSQDPLEIQLRANSDSSSLLFKICFPTAHKLAIISNKQCKQIFAQMSIRALWKTKKHPFVFLSQGEEGSIYKRTDYSFSSTKSYSDRK
jgi:hypothetical protein